MKLNPDQEKVASHTRGRIIALAGPGSGKTRTLTERTVRMLKQGVKPESILCLTFTNRARDEMRERLTLACGSLSEKVFISNFHGLCGMILRTHGAPLGYTRGLTICDSDDQIDLLLQLARRKGIELTRPAARNLAIAVNDWREALGTALELDRGLGGRIRRAESSVGRAYIDLLRARNQCDFSGLLSETVRLLQEHPTVQKTLQKRFRYIQVDEYQDTNRAQNALVEMLANAEDNILAIGDVDQSIYEWRGATPDAIPQFIKNGHAKTSDCKVIKLGLNYRSTPQIIAVADQLIRHAADRIAVEFSTTKPDGEPVKCVAFDNAENEAEGIAANIQNLLKVGHIPKEMAVFYRTNDMSRAIEQALAKRQIPYQVIGSGSYYERMEVRDVLAMLRFLANPKDGISFARIANKPARGMGDTLIGRLEAYAEKLRIDLLTALHDSHVRQLRDEHDKPLADAAVRACRETREVFDIPLAHHTVAEIAREVLRRSRYDQWLKDRYEDKGEYDDRQRNVNELIHSIDDYSRRSRRATLDDYLESIALYTEADDVKTDNAVRLMSLHASKGLEFDVVYIIGLEQGILPHARAIEDRKERGLEEERRLCYVGFTRARKLLRVTWAKKRISSATRNDKGGGGIPSRFLLESGLMPAEEYAALTRRPPRS